MKRVDELIEKTKVSSKDWEYWLALEEEISGFMSNPENSREDKNKLKYLGQTESVYMICQGYRHMMEEKRGEK